jgi:hypothetical protein
MSTTAIASGSGAFAPGGEHNRHSLKFVLPLCCQRKHQVPLGDRLAERSVLGPLDVDVNPLVVVGGVREAVDAVPA